MARSANDGWEDSPGGIITSETSFAHAGAIVDNKSSNVFISHFRFELFSTDNCQKKMRLCHTTTVDLGLKQKSRDSV